MIVLVQILCSFLIWQEVNSPAVSAGATGINVIGAPYTSSTKNTRHRSVVSSSCDRLFSLESSQLQSNTWIIPAVNRTIRVTCIVHNLLGVTACDLGPIQVDLSRVLGSSYGNESIADVLGRSEAEEQLTYETGALTLRSSSAGDYFQHDGVGGLLAPKDFAQGGEARLLDAALWMPTPTTDTENTPTKPAEGWFRMFSRLLSLDLPQAKTIRHSADRCTGEVAYFIPRGDYALLPKVVSTLYNVWLTDQILGGGVTGTSFDWRVDGALGGKPAFTCPPHIIWLDANAYGGATDHVYNDLFGNAAHLRHIGSKNMNGKRSLLTFRRAIFLNEVSPFWAGLPLHSYSDSSCKSDSGLHQFREFVLQRYNIQHKAPYHATADKKKKVLTFLVRKNYKGHPRSNGHTDRQVADVELETTYLQRDYPQHNVNIVSFEDMSMSDQIRKITSTDLLVAVHGAGNTHAIFLPENSTFIEYIPKGFEGRTRFKFLSHCLGIGYEQRPAKIVERFKDGMISVSLRVTR